MAYSVCASGCNGRFEAEWLFDLLWYKRNAEGTFVATPLILESEFSIALADVKYDFEKLLAYESPIRVMVFEPPVERIEEYFSELERIIHAYPSWYPFCRYILAAFDNDDFRFRTKMVPRRYKPIQEARAAIADQERTASLGLSQLESSDSRIW